MPIPIPIPIIYGLDWALVAQRRAGAPKTAPALGQGRGQGPIQSIYYWYIIGLGIGNGPGIGIGILLVSVLVAARKGSLLILFILKQMRNCHMCI